MENGLPPQNSLAELAALGAGVFLISIFFPLSVVSFFQFQLRTRKKRLREVVRIVRRSCDDVRRVREAKRGLRAVYSQQDWQDYVLPVSFASFTSLLGSYILFLGGETFVAPGHNLLLHGMALPDHDWTSDPYLLNEWRRLLVLGMAFIGGFLWSAKNVFRRLVTADLTPGTYYNAGLRLIFSGITAVMLSYFLESVPQTENGENVLPVLAFLTGIFPERALRFLRDRVRIFRDKEVAEVELPLEKLQGVNALHRARLEEMGIDDAQNLAEADPIDLLLKTPYSASQIVDWIAQAKLLVHFKSKISKLREVGVRTIFDLCTAGESGRLKEIGDHTQLQAIALDLVYRSLAKDPEIERLRAVGRFLANGTALPSQDPDSGSPGTVLETPIPQPS